MTRSGALLVLLLLPAAPWPARAAPDAHGPPSAQPRRKARAARPDAPWKKGVSPENQARAREPYILGNARFAESQYAEALKHYRRALLYWDHPNIRYNAAVCLINLGKHVEAHHFLKQALRFGRGPLRGHYSQARAYLKLLMQRLALVRIVCRELGARVELNGKTIFYGPAKKVIALPAGQHLLAARKAGFFTVTRNVSILPGQRITVTLKLIPDALAITQKRRWSRAMPWAVFSAAFAVAVAGVPLLLQGLHDAQRYRDQLSTACPLGCEAADVPSAIEGLGGRAQAEYGAGITLSTIGGLGVLVGAVLLVLNRPRSVPLTQTESSSHPRSLQVVPVLRPGGAGVLAGFTF